jgi:dTDP-4-dehydrorhamnose 3,5-epimerase (EC 5.1.3.13)
VSSLLIFATPIAGLKVVERSSRGDRRGFLARLFCADELADAGWCKPVAQVNQTFTKMAGTVRGLHFQHPPQAEMKLVTCLQGAIWDVAVDIRAGSPTFLQWHAEELSASNRRAMLIPEGLAHGFQTLTDECGLIYLHTAAYSPACEAGLHPRDPLLSIAWPRPIAELSARDAKHPLLDDQFNGVSS